MHSEALKAEYERNPNKNLGFEYDYMRDLQKIIGDCDRRIETAQRRLEKTPDEIMKTNSLVCTPYPLKWTCFFANGRLTGVYS